MTSAPEARSAAARAPIGIVDAVAAAIRDPRTHHYSDAAGLPALRAEIAAALGSGVPA
jgi:aspartate/methionine/tyrosine aminotransferase